jgi:hypothetical protein
MSKRFPKRWRNAETPEELANPPVFPPEPEFDLMKEAKPVLIGFLVMGAILVLAGVFWTAYNSVP